MKAVKYTTAIIICTLLLYGAGTLVPQHHNELQEISLILPETDRQIRQAYYEEGHAAAQYIELKNRFDQTIGYAVITDRMTLVFDASKSVRGVVFEDDYTPEQRTLIEQMVMDARPVHYRKIREEVEDAVEMGRKAIR